MIDKLKEKLKANRIKRRDARTYATIQGIRDPRVREEVMAMTHGMR